jgi:hypothetical protein
MKRINLLFFAIVLASTFASAAPLPATGWFDDYLSINANGAGATSYYIGTTGTGSALQGIDFGSVSSLSITSCDMKYWSSTQDRTGGAFYYKIMSADGATQVVAPVETIWDQVKLPATNDYQGTKATEINVLSGLNPGSYRLHVYAKSWGSGQGDSWLSNGGANYWATFSTPAVMITGANGIADGTYYSTLKAAFDAINLQPDQTGKNIEIKIGASTTETASAVLNQPTTASWTSLTIYPTTANVTIGGVFTNTLIDINGADNVTITGKLNKTGATQNLTLSQTENTNNASRTIRIWNDAANNTITNCIVRGSCISSGAGVIFLGDAKAAGTGNDNNIIEYCNINAAGAANGIKATSTVAIPSEGNIIRNNNVYDFYISNTSTTATAGIDVSTNYTTSTITGNSLYQTAARAYSATSTLHLGINVGGTSNGNTISDNYIGGSAPQCGGTAWTITGGLYRLFSLQTSFGTTTASSIQGNVISNIDITSAYSSSSSAFIGHQHATGTVNIGTITGNTVGSVNAAGSIKVKLTAAGGCLVVGINLGAGIANISNNKIGGIIVDLNNSATRAHFYGISAAGAGPVTYTKNLIGSLTVPNSIEHKGSTYNTYATSQSNLRGLSIGNTGGTTIEENVISNLTCSSIGSNITNGIYTNSASLATSIKLNIIRDLKSYGTRPNTGSTASMIGIIYAGNNNGNIIGNNTIYNLNNATNTADGVEAYGIFFETINTGISTIEKNKIYGITTASTSTNANIIGVYISNGLTNTQNNMIALGSGLTTAINMSGIRKSNTKANNFYHNTVVLSGSEVGVAGTTNTFAFLKTGSPTSPAVDVVQNNILINNRSNASGNTQKHYVINVEGTGALTSDNNNLYANGTGSIFGIVGISPSTTEYSTLAAWKTGTSKDAASVSKEVELTSTSDLSLTGTSINDAELGAPLLATVSTDISGVTTRKTITYMGAYEASDLTVAAPTKVFTVTVPNGTSKVYVTGNFTGKNLNITNPYELTATANPNEFTGTFACANDITYKYLCEKGDLDYQEAIYQGGGDPIKLTNRTYNAADVVPIWFRVNKITLNASFATNVPNTLFVKGSFNGWASGVEMTKSGSTFSTILGGNVGDKYPANTLYKYYTNDEVNDNWECNAGGSVKDNRWSVAPVMNDEIARFTLQTTTGNSKNAEQMVRIIPTVLGVQAIFVGEANIELFTINGLLIEKTIASGSYTRNLVQGAYIIRINGKATKFIK